MNRKKGFTLIELLVVIAIIGILSSIVLVALRGARNKAKDGRIIAEMSQLRGLAEVTYDGGAYDIASHSDYTTLQSDIEEQAPTGETLTLVEDSEYCAYIQLNEGDDYCVDSTGFAGEVSDASTTCNSTGPSYTCQ